LWEPYLPGVFRAALPSGAVLPAMRDSCDADPGIRVVRRRDRISINFLLPLTASHADIVYLQTNSVTFHEFERPEEAGKRV
jgi:hypothetical protein